jgi:hypothetical protein
MSIGLDKRADIFMNLNGAIDEIKLPVSGDEVYVHNSWTDSVPTVIHGNGPSEVKNKFSLTFFKVFFLLENFELFK